MFIDHDRTLTSPNMPVTGVPDPPDPKLPSSPLRVSSPLRSPDPPEPGSAPIALATFSAPACSAPKNMLAPLSRTRSDVVSARSLASNPTNDTACVTIDIVVAGLFNRLERATGLLAGIAVTFVTTIHAGLVPCSDASHALLYPGRVQGAGLSVGTDTAVWNSSVASGVLPGLRGGELGGGGDGGGGLGGGGPGGGGDGGKSGGYDGGGSGVDESRSSQYSTPAPATIADTMKHAHTLRNAPPPVLACLFSDGAPICTAAYLTP